MMNNLTLASTTLVLLLFALTDGHSDQSAISHPSIAVRHSRTASTSPSVEKKADCRYDKGIWYECDRSTGLQKRVLKLRQGSSNDCEQEKVLTRPCKRAPCKYTKGNWSACTDGLRSRIDQVKGPNSEGCESFRTVTRKCKVICRYSRSDWGPCEGSLKTKKLTLVEGNAGVCEVSKSITKQCGPASIAAGLHPGNDNSNSNSNSNNNNSNNNNSNNNNNNNHGPGGNNKGSVLGVRKNRGKNLA